LVYISARSRHNLITHLLLSHDWSSLEKQVGMFYYSGLTESQGLVLAKKHHVYILPPSGRINVGAVTARNLEYVAAAIASVVNENKS
jgi:aspartate/tyrosine/aromatic aminotransferase